MTNTTREGIEVKVGQVWEDLDKRMGGRQVKVLSIWVGLDRGRNPCMYVDVRPMELFYPGSRRYQRASTLRLDKMHEHSTGWKLIQEAQ